MSIEKIFAKERDRYVQFLVETRTKIINEAEKTVSELLISINNEAIPYPYRYLRVDVMSTSPDGLPKPYEVKIDIDPAFEAKGFNFGEFIVEVYPFTWNAVQILVDKPINNLKQLEGWITRWLDVEDKNIENEQGLGQTIHSFTPIDHHGEWWYLTGDFGSAPADALLEFVELLAGQGISRIIIKSGEVNA
jgi:hypothetical protein